MEGVAVDEEGHVLVAGRIVRDAGIASDGTAGMNAGFLLKLNDTGQPLWSRCNVGESYWDIASDGRGNVFLAGSGSAGSGSAGSEQAPAAFVRKVDATGATLWESVVEPPTVAGAGQETETRVSVSALAVDDSDNIVVAGSVWSGGGGFTTSQDSLVQLLAPDGETMWTKLLGHPAPDLANGVGIDSAGNVIVVGNAWGSIAGGEGTGSYLWKLDPEGAAVWIRQFGTHIDDDAKAVSIGSDDTIVIIGSGYGVHPAATSGSSVGSYVRAFDAEGDSLWLRPFGTGRWDVVRGLAIEADGEASVVGQVAPSASDVGGGSLETVVESFSASGMTSWVSSIETVAGAQGSAIALSTAGDVIVAGRSGADSSAGDNIRNSRIFVLRMGDRKGPAASGEMIPGPANSDPAASGPAVSSPGASGQAASGETYFGEVGRAPCGQ